jgi:hypothetical protein
VGLVRADVSEERVASIIRLKGISVLGTELRVTSSSYGLQRMVSSGMLRRVALVRTDVSEELSVSFIRVTRIDELGITLAVTSN